MTDALLADGPPVDDADDIAEIIIAEETWATRLRGGAAALETLTERALVAAIAASGLPERSVSVSFLFTNDAEMASLNGRFRGREAPTNVLSWPAFTLEAPVDAAWIDGFVDAPAAMGDVALGLETVQREALEADKRLEDHISHLIVHGVLHLFGFSHEIDEDAVVMERRECVALAALGVADPYMAADRPSGDEDEGASAHG